VERSLSRGRGNRAFTLLEVALIVAIIGMMLMMIIGYLLAPKPTGPLPPVAEPTPIPSTSASPVPSTPAPVVAPATPAPAKATPASTPAQTIELSPQAPTLFR